MHRNCLDRAKMPGQGLPMTGRRLRPDGGWPGGAGQRQEV